MNILRAVLTLLVLLIANPSFAESGISIGGGGGESVPRESGTNILKDYLIVDQNYEDSNQVSIPEIGRVFHRSVIPKTASNDQFRLPRWGSDTGPITNKEDSKQLLGKSDPYQLLQYWMLKWQKANSTLGLPTISEIRSIMSHEKLVWKLGNILDDPYAAWFQFSPYSQSKKTLILIDIDRWNKMGVWSQAGLLLHETLRYRQIVLSGQFNNLILETVVALLMNCNPEAPSATKILLYADTATNRTQSGELSNLEDSAKKACERIR